LARLWADFFVVLFEMRQQLSIADYRVFFNPDLPLGCGGMAVDSAGLGRIGRAASTGVTDHFSRPRAP
jgi:hypothetical protein